MSDKPRIQPNPITRAIIDSTVDRGLREIDEDPKRSVRKLTDLGRLFTKGRFTDEIYALVQDLLHNDDSPYYTAIERLLRHTSKQNLKTFGINIGYNGLNIGGKIDRSTAGSRAYRTPWLISIRVNPSIPNSMSVSEVENVIGQAKPLGIYCFAIRLEGSLLSLNSLLDVINKYKDCAFFFIIPDQKLTPIHLENIQNCHSALFLIHTESPFAAANAEALRRQKSFFGAYSFYDDQSAASWLTGKRIKEFLPYEVPVAVLLADDTCSAKNQMRIAKYCRTSRMHPEYPLLIFDSIGDICAIDRMRSEQDYGCYFEILETGDVRTGSEIITDFRHTVSLEQLLTISLPSAQ